MNLKERVKKHNELCKEMTALYEDKNIKYGNSFAETFAKRGPVSFLTQLDHKVSRLDTLMMNPNLDPGDESIRQNLMDTANYCLMAIMELEAQQPVIEEVAPQPPQKKKKKKKVKEEAPVVDEAPHINPGLEKELGEYSKAELTKVAKALNLEVPKKANKTNLIQLIGVQPEKQIDAALDSLFPEIKEDITVEADGAEA